MAKIYKIRIGKCFAFLFLFSLLFYFIYRSRNYERVYFLNDVSITESFNKQDKVYRFEFKVGDTTFLTSMYHRFIHTKELIKGIDVKQKDDVICILIESEKIHLYPMCQKNGENISYHLIEDEELIPSSYKSNLSYEEKEYKTLKLYSLGENKYYLWNYTGFYVLTKNQEKEIKLFQTDVYNIPLTAVVGQYLVIANYDEKYNFNKFYVIDTKKDKVRELNLKDTISFDSYFLGSFDGKLYLVDRKNKMEYEINPKKLQMEVMTKKNQGQILKEDQWETIGMQALVGNENSFTYKSITSYTLLDGNLYRVQEDYKTKISNQMVKEIVLSTEDAVYYLVGDNLYVYDDKDGERLILNNFEWNFNYQNMIYIF